MQDHDLFETGDKVWCGVYGFGEVKYSHGGIYPNIEIAFYNSTHKGVLCCTHTGHVIAGFDAVMSERTVFHAVADTDAAMRTAIARGEGLKRPAPRGRWPIQPGDRVMLVRSGGITLVNRAKDRGFACGNYLEVAGAAITNMGIFLNTGYPIAMVLRDKEEPFESALENMRWMMDEAIKEGWYEKCGKK